MDRSVKRYFVGHDHCRRERHSSSTPWIPVFLITSGRNTVHHSSTLIDPRRLPDWKVGTRPRLRFIYYSSSPASSPAAHTRVRRDVARVRDGEVHLIPACFERTKGGWKIAGNFGNARPLCLPASPSRLHLIKGAWSSSGLRKNFQPPHAHTRNGFTHSRGALSQSATRTNCITGRWDIVPYPCLPLAHERTRVVHRITRRWRSPYFTRYRSRRVLICTSQNLPTVVSRNPDFQFVNSWIRLFSCRKTLLMRKKRF